MKTKERLSNLEYNFMQLLVEIKDIKEQIGNTADKEKPEQWIVDLGESMHKSYVRMELGLMEFKRQENIDEQIRMYERAIRELKELKNSVKLIE